MAAILAIGSRSLGCLGSRKGDRRMGNQEQRRDKERKGVGEGTFVVIVRGGRKGKENSENR